MLLYQVMDLPSFVLACRDEVGKGRGCHLAALVELIGSGLELHQLVAVHGEEGQTS